MNGQTKETGMKIGLGVAVAALSSIAIWGLGWGFTNDEALDDHRAIADPHPILAKEIQHNYDKIQIQQQAIVDDVQEIKGSMKSIDDKLDRALEDG